MSDWLKVLAALCVIAVALYWGIPWVGGAMRDSKNRRDRERAAAVELEEERRRKFHESLQPPRHRQKVAVVRINADATAFVEGIKKAVAAVDTANVRAERAMQAFIEAQACAELELILAGLSLASDRFQMTLEEAVSDDHEDAA